MSGRSFERRHRLALRRTNSPQADLESDSAIAERVASGLVDDRPVGFVVFRRVQPSGPDDVIALTEYLGRSSRAVDPDAVVRLLADGAVVCVLGPFESRHDGHGAVDALFARASSASGDVFDGVVGGFSLTGNETDAATAIEQAVVASHHADEDAPFKAFTPFMTLDADVELCIDLTLPGSAEGLVSERLVDMNLNRTFGIVVSALGTAGGLGVAFSFRDAAEAVRRTASEFSTVETWVSPPAIWLDMSTIGLQTLEERVDLTTAIAAVGRTVGLVFAEAEVAGLDPVPMAALNEIARSGVPLALRDFSGRHVGLTRLPDLGISQVTFEPGFIEDAVSGSARALIGDIVVSLESIGIHTVVRSENGDLAPELASTGIHRVRTETSEERLIVTPLPADKGEER